MKRRARLVSAIARGRRWLDEILTGSVTDVQQIATRQKCSVRQVNMTISLAFLPTQTSCALRSKVALPRGVGVERLRDAPAEWSRAVRSPRLEPPAISADRFERSVLAPKTPPCGFPKFGKTGLVGGCKPPHRGERNFWMHAEIGMRDRKCEQRPKWARNDSGNPAQKRPI